MVVISISLLPFSVAHCVWSLGHGPLSNLVSHQPCLPSQGSFYWWED